MDKLCITLKSRQWCLSGGGSFENSSAFVTQFPLLVLSLQDDRP